MKDIIKNQNKFTRIIGKNTIYSENGEVILYKIQKKTSSITKKILPKNNKLSNKFISMDLVLPQARYCFNN